MIRVYGFVHDPYVFPSFLTPRIFALEMIREKRIVEHEHFINFRNTLEIKFPWVVGTFVIKRKASLLVVEGMLK